MSYRACKILLTLLPSSGEGENGNKSNRKEHVLVHLEEDESIPEDQITRLYDGLHRDPNPIIPSPPIFPSAIIPLEMESALETVPSPSTASAAAPASVVPPYDQRNVRASDEPHIADSDPSHAIAKQDTSSRTAVEPPVEPTLNTTRLPIILETILLNKADARIDGFVDLPTDSTMTTPLRTNENPLHCEAYHLQGSCIAGEACLYSHGTISNDQLALLLYTARQTPCRNKGMYCRDGFSIHGHHCPTPGCKGPSHSCNFDAEMHPVNFLVVKLIPADHMRAKERARKRAERKAKKADKEAFQVQQISEPAGLEEGQEGSSRGGTSKDVEGEAAKKLGANIKKVACGKQSVIEDLLGPVMEDKLPDPLEPTL